MGLLRAIFAGLKNTLAAALDAIWWIVTAPARLFMPGPGRSAVPPPPDVAKQIADAIAQTDELEAARASGLVPPSGPPAAGYAGKIMRWAAATVADRHGTAERISATLPAGLRTWTLGLTNDQARSLLNARIAGISAHIDGSAPIDGVRPLVRPVRTDGVRPERMAVRSRREARELRAPVLGF